MFPEGSDLIENPDGTAPGIKLALPAADGWGKNMGSVVYALPGVPAEMMADIMLPFRTTKANGSGIGLSVCQDLVDVHHGRLSLRNKPSGGIVAQVCLPLYDEKQDTVV